MAETMSASQKAALLGATVESGISWIWAKGFPTPETAHEFITWLDLNGYDHRGYYPAEPESEDEKRVDGVRFR